MIRRIVHAVVALVLWVVFVLYWRIVMLRPMNPDTKVALVSLAILSVATIICLIIWVFHNKRIFRRYGRRTQRRRGLRDPIQDFLGRWVIADQPEALRSANYIEVELKSSIVSDKTVEEKIFRTSRRLNPS